jgi:hypothetical protein
VSSGKERYVSASRLRAATNVAGLFKSLTQSLLHILWLIHDHQDWKLRGYDSLYLWAKVELLPFFVERYHDPDAYMRRLCNSVVAVLGDVQSQHIKHPDTGAPITVEDIIANTAVSNLKEAPYTYEEFLSLRALLSGDRFQWLFVDALGYHTLTPYANEELPSCPPTTRTPSTSRPSKPSTPSTA